MPWIDAVEVYARPPITVGPLSATGIDEIVDLDDRWGSIEGARITGPLDATNCERIEIRGSVLTGVRIDGAAGVALDLDRCELVDCDLSTLRLRSITSTRLTGCKLTGCDLKEATLRDVELDHCVLRLVNARMSELERVTARECTLDDVDLFDASLIDVSLPGSRLRVVDGDRARFQRVDLREAVEVDLRSIRTLDGCLVSAEQVVELAFVLAHAAGVGIERPPDPG